MAPHGKELSEDLRIRIVALHRNGLGQGSASKFGIGPKQFLSLDGRPEDS